MWSSQTSEIDNRPESAVHHALHIKRHRFRIHLRGELRILHHLGIDAIAMRPRLVDDPGEHHRLAWLQSSQARERNAHLHLEVVAEALAELERAVLSPDATRFLRYTAVGVDVLLRDGDDESVDVWHRVLPCKRKSYGDFDPGGIGGRPVRGRIYLHKRRRASCAGELRNRAGHPGVSPQLQARHSDAGGPGGNWLSDWRPGGVAASGS